MWAVFFFWSMEYSTNCFLVSHTLSACYLHELWGGGGRKKSNGLVSPLVLRPPPMGWGRGGSKRGPIFRSSPPVTNTYWFKYYMFLDIISDFRNWIISNVVFINTFLCGYRDFYLYDIKWLKFGLKNKRPKIPPLVERVCCWWVGMYFGISCSLRWLPTPITTERRSAMWFIRDKMC